MAMFGVEDEDGEFMWSVEEEHAKGTSYIVIARDTIMQMDTLAGL